MTESTLIVTFNKKNLDNARKDVYRYLLTIRIANNSSKTIHNLNVEYKFHVNIPIETDAFAKGEEEKVDKMLYVKYNSIKEFKIQPGKDVTLPIIFHYDDSGFENKLIDTDFYWTIYADDMLPLKGNHHLRKFIEE
jgi:hypothetical protein